MSHPFLHFRNHINSLFDDFHNDFFNDPFFKDDWNQQQQQRGNQRRLNYSGEPSSRQQPSLQSTDDRLALRNPSAGWGLTTWADQQLTPVSTIHLNVSEEADKYVVDADLPGMKKEDVRLNIQDGYLTISGERKEVHQEGNMGVDGKSTDKKGKDQQQPQRRWVRREVNYGAVQRTVALPRDVDQQKITAKHESGVLRIMMPKKEVPSQQGTIQIM